MAKLTYKDVKIGMKFKLKTDRFTSYGYSKGDTVEVTYSQNNQINISGATTSSSSQCISVNVNDLEVVIQTKVQIQEEIDAAEQVIADNKAKLKWMKDTKNDIYDEDEFKVWQVLETLDSNSSQAAKAKAIAQLIKNK